MKNQFKVFSPQKRRKFYPTDLELILHKVKNRTKVLILKSIVLRTNRQSNRNSKSIFIYIYSRNQSEFRAISKMVSKKNQVCHKSPCVPWKKDGKYWSSLPIQNRLNVRYSLLYAHMQIICFQHISLVSFATISTALIYYLQ